MSSITKPLSRKYVAFRLTLRNDPLLLQEANRLAKYLRGMSFGFLKYLNSESRAELRDLAHTMRELAARLESNGENGDVPWD